jgi:hypothetical protein
MKSNSPTTLLSRRLANSELVLRQLRHLAGHLPCQLCELKGGSNIESDGGCRHRGSVDEDTFDLHVMEKIERFIRAHHPNLSACIECGGGTEVAETSEPI